MSEGYASNGKRANKKCFGFVKGRFLFEKKRINTNFPDLSA